MEYVLTSSSGKTVLRTKGRKHSELVGYQRLSEKYGDEVITDSFRVIKKLRSNEDSGGNCYDWYEVDQHYRTSDRSGALAEKMNKTNAALADAVCELDALYDARIARLEDTILSFDKDLNGGK